MNRSVLPRATSSLAGASTLAFLAVTAIAIGCGGSDDASSSSSSSSGATTTSSSSSSSSGGKSSSSSSSGGASSSSSSSGGASSSSSSSGGSSSSSSGNSTTVQACPGSPTDYASSFQEILEMTPCDDAACTPDTHCCLDAASLLGGGGIPGLGDAGFGGSTSVCVTAL